VPKDFSAALSYSVPLPKISEFQKVMRFARGSGFLEIFAGEGGLSGCMREKGGVVFDPMDIRTHSRFDLTRRCTQRAVLQAIEEGFFWMVHFGTPCTVWCNARRNITNFGKAREKERVGIELAAFTAVCCELCDRRGVLWSVENPKTSLLWEFDPMLELRLSTGAQFVEFDQCMYGGMYRKSTRVLTNCKQLSGLGVFCDRSHVHAVMEGQERYLRDDGVWSSRCKTAGAAAYPPLLCKRWADILSTLQPAVGAFADESVSLGESFVARLDAAAQRIQRFRAPPGLARPEGVVGSPHVECSANPDFHIDVGGEFYYFNKYSGLCDDIVFGQHSRQERAAKRARRALGTSRLRWPAVAKL
jgi:hypothetical protein